MFKTPYHLYSTMSDKTGQLVSDISPECAEPVGDIGLIEPMTNRGDLNMVLLMNGIKNFNSTGIMHLGTPF